MPRRSRRSSAHYSKGSAREEEEEEEVEMPEEGQENDSVMQMDESEENVAVDLDALKSPVSAAQTDNEKSLMDFLEMMDTYQPIIPDAVLDHYFGRAGFDCPDVRIKRFLGLAAQKFISDVAQDSYQYFKVRQQGMSSKDRKNASKKNVLTMEDLSAAMAEYGVNARRPDYYT